MGHRRTLAAACLVAVMGTIGAGCTQEEVARFSIASIFPVDQQDTAVRVARCESRFDPEAVNHGNYGVFQINEVNRATVEDAGLDWERVKVETWSNVMAAWVLWMRAGWRIWSCR